MRWMGWLSPNGRFAIATAGWMIMQMLAYQGVSKLVKDWEIGAWWALIPLYLLTFGLAMATWQVISAGGVLWRGGSPWKEERENTIARSLKALYEGDAIKAGTGQLSYNGVMPTLHNLDECLESLKANMIRDGLVQDVLPIRTNFVPKPTTVTLPQSQAQFQNNQAGLNQSPSSVAQNKPVSILGPLGP